MSKKKTLAYRQAGKKQLSTTERHLGVVLENIDSKLSSVVEGHKVLDKKVDKTNEKIDNLKKENDYQHEVILDELRLIRNELKEKVGRDEFGILEKRVIFLERKLSRGHA